MTVEWGDILFFFGPALLGALVGFLLGLRKSRVTDTSWRREPTFTRGATYSLPETDHMGRREPTFTKKDTQE